MKLGKPPLAAAKAPHQSEAHAPTIARDCGFVPSAHTRVVCRCASPGSEARREAAAADGFGTDRGLYERTARIEAAARTGGTAEPHPRAGARAHEARARRAIRRRRLGELRDRGAAARSGSRSRHARARRMESTRTGVDRALTVSLAGEGAAATATADHARDHERSVRRDREARLLHARDHASVRRAIGRRSARWSVRR